jgi:hypothetical protein
MKARFRRAYGRYPGRWKPLAFAFCRLLFSVHRMGIQVYQQCSRSCDSGLNMPNRVTRKKCGLWAEHPRRSGGAAARGVLLTRSDLSTAATSV